MADDGMPKVHVRAADGSISLQPMSALRGSTDLAKHLAEARRLEEAPLPPPIHISDITRSMMATVCVRWRQAQDADTFAREDPEHEEAELVLQHWLGLYALCSAHADLFLELGLVEVASDFGELSGVATQRVSMITDVLYPASDGYDRETLQ